MEYTLEQQLQDTLDDLTRTSRLLGIFQRRISDAIRLCERYGDTSECSRPFDHIHDVLTGSSEHTPPAAP